MPLLKFQSDEDPYQDLSHRSTSEHFGERIEAKKIAEAVELLRLCFLQIGHHYEN